MKFLKAKNVPNGVLQLGQNCTERGITIRPRLFDTTFTFTSKGNQCGTTRLEFRNSCNEYTPTTTIINAFCIDILLKLYLQRCSYSFENKTNITKPRPNAVHGFGPSHRF